MGANARWGQVVGHIRRRLLVNFWVDPGEAASHLPDGLRPHIGSNGGVIVGCCMIELDNVRPSPMPVGAGVRAAAHRICCEVGAPERATRAVFVPSRQTDALLPVLAGGRLFPGVHRRAEVRVSATDKLHWAVRDKGRGDPFSITATADLVSGRPTSGEVAQTVIGTTLGLSPGHRRGSIEAVEMEPDRLDAQEVDLVQVDSKFIAGFTTAEPAETLLMTDVAVTWRAAARKRSLQS